MPACYHELIACLCVVMDLCKKTLKQIIWRKTIAIYNVFKKKTTKIILEKKHKKTEGEKQCRETL